MLQLTVPLSVLSALGLNFFYTAMHKRIFKPRANIAGAILVFLLLFFFFRMFTHTNVYVEKQPCFFDELGKARKLIGNNCIAVDNVNLDLRTPAKRVFEYFFYGKRVVSEPECNRYLYFSLKDVFFKPVREHPLMSFFRKNCVLKSLGDNRYFELYRAVCRHSAYP